MRTRRRLAAALAALIVGFAATLLAPLAASAEGVAPVLTAITPRAGLSAGGATVTLTGSGFTGATAVVFGGVASPSVTVVSDSEIIASSPPHQPGVVGVTVMTPAGSSVPATTTTFTYSGPYVIKVTPDLVSVAGGTIIAVTGSGFANVSAVQIGSTPVVSFKRITNMVLSVMLPAQPVGVEDLTVTTPIGTSPAVKADRVTFVVPAVYLVMPTSGPANRSTTVELTGTGLIGATAVDFGTVAATTFTVHGPTAITALAPPEAADTVAVTVVTPAGVTAVGPRDYFTYEPPTVTRVMPASGPPAGGTRVMITGTLLGGLSAVTFGGVPATSYIRESSGILAVAPPGAAGTVDVQVTTSGGTSLPVKADHFTYT